MKTLFLRYPHKSNDRQRYEVNAQAMEHHRYEKLRVVVTFLAEHSLMPLLYGLFPHLVGTILKRNRVHNDATPVHRNCITFPLSARISQQPPHLRCLQRSQGKEHQKTRSYTWQSIYWCGEDTDGALVDFRVPSGGNFVCSQNERSGNVFHLSLDLSACDYFLWGHLKSNVFISKPTTIG
jgi:hypothetical protein